MNKEKEKLDKFEKKSLHKKVPSEFHEYISVFSNAEASRMPEHTEYDHKIELKQGFIPKFESLPNRSH
jgi:hypothetical protein